MLVTRSPPPPPPLGVSVAKHRAPVPQTCGLGRASSDTSKNFRFEVQTCSWKTVIGASCPPAPQSYRCLVILTEPRGSANQIMHTVFKTCCWLLTADLSGSEGLAHFQIWICLGTKPVSCLLVFFILFSLRIFAFPKKCTWFRRLVSHFMCTRRCQAGATFKTLAACEIPVAQFIRVFNILHSIVPSIPCLPTKWKNKTKTSITSWQKEKRNIKAGPPLRLF